MKQAMPRSPDNPMRASIVAQGGPLDGSGTLTVACMDLDGKYTGTYTDDKLQEG